MALPLVAPLIGLGKGLLGGLAGLGKKVAVTTAVKSVAKKGKGRLICEVSECEFLGSETFIGLSHPSAKGLTISMPGVQNIDQGKNLEISFANEDLHFFDVNGDRTS